jgi:hexosaminidase
MKKRITSVLLLLLLSSIAFAQQADEVSIIPKPASVEKGMGSFVLSKRTNIVARGADAEKVAGMFNYSSSQSLNFK